MTSSQVLNSVKVSDIVSYRIVGKSMSLPVDVGLCDSVATADEYAICQASKYRKVVLYKKVNNEEKEVIYRSHDYKKDFIEARWEKFFKDSNRSN